MATKQDEFSTKEKEENERKANDLETAGEEGY
jgi:hypothetical protein